MKRWIAFVLLVLVAIAVLYIVVEMNWSYSTGERAGWIQKFSRKGWLCKTWEGEMAMVTMPGTIPEKFDFTVWDESVVAQINRTMGQRVSLSYEQKKALPTSCFGDTEYWVTGVRVLSDIPPIPGAVPAPSPVPGAIAAPTPAPGAAAAPSAAPGAAPAPSPASGSAPAASPAPPGR